MNQRDAAIIAAPIDESLQQHHAEVKSTSNFYSQHQAQKQTYPLYDDSERIQEKNHTILSAINAKPIQNRLFTHEKQQSSSHGSFSYSDLQLHNEPVTVDGQSPLKNVPIVSSVKWPKNNITSLSSVMSAKLPENSKSWTKTEDVDLPSSVSVPLKINTQMQQLSLLINDCHLNSKVFTESSLNIEEALPNCPKQKSASSFQMTSKQLSNSRFPSNRSQLDARLSLNSNSIPISKLSNNTTKDSTSVISSTVDQVSRLTSTDSAYLCTTSNIETSICSRPLFTSAAQHTANSISSSSVYSVASSNLKHSVSNSSLSCLEVSLANRPHIPGATCSASAFELCLDGQQFSRSLLGSRLPANNDNQKSQLKELPDIKPLLAGLATPIGTIGQFVPKNDDVMPKTDPSQCLSHQFQNVKIKEEPLQMLHSYKSSTELPPKPKTSIDWQQADLTGSLSDLDSSSTNDLIYNSYGSQMKYHYQQQQQQQQQQQRSRSITKQGFNKIWGMESTDIIQYRNILPKQKVEPPKIKLHQDQLDCVNCSPEIFRCTLTKIPESNSLLQKARLPLGILIHPFKDLNHLPVIQCNTIVRCRSCRTYINPFVYFIDSKRWKCNLCYKVNELPDEFQFDPATKSYGDPSRRPEIRTSTIEFIAPSEYMLRPPQPAVYLFLFDVSRLAVESGYLTLVCNIIIEELSRIPGDSRTQIGFLAINSAVHLFSMPDNVSQPHHMVVMDIEEVFLPCPENFLVNLNEREELLKSLLVQIPQMFKDTHDTNCALGAALQAAYKLTSPTGGRITVFQSCLPNVGPGALQSRENPNVRAGKDVPWLNPATDFYKRLALDCSGQQIAVDLFLLNCQYSDLASLSGICKFSGGCIYNVPLFQGTRLPLVEVFDKMLRRYLSRKIGFEAVMRVRCTRGINVHTFHGNFFVRSTDLLSLPNVNPDAGFGMQLTIDENLSDTSNCCFQAALLYTSSRGERRIRVHTLSLPTTSNLSEVLYSADQQCIVGLLAKMAVDRSISSSLSDAREALINAVIDPLAASKLLQSYPGSGLLVPDNLKLLPMYIIALLKSRAFRFGVSTRVDDRFYAMCQLKTLPLGQLIQYIYPDLYAIHDYVTQQMIETDNGQLYQFPARLHLSAEKLDSGGAFLLDHCDRILVYVGKNVQPSFCHNVLGISSFAAIPEEMYGLPELASIESERLRTFVTMLQEEKPYSATLQVIRDDGHFKTEFTERLIEDRFENALSYYEFLQHIKTQVI